MIITETDTKMFFLIPTLFMTLSAADLYWPELTHVLDDDPAYFNALDATAKLNRRAQFIIENPHFAAYFFQQRAEAFIKQVLIPKFKIKDYWYRTEFQHRGSPHIHGLFWLENAPSLKLSTQISEDMQAQLKTIKDYFDVLVSTWIVNENVPFGPHPSSKHYSDVTDHDEDFNQLLRVMQVCHH